MVHISRWIWFAVVAILASPILGVNALDNEGSKLRRKTLKAEGKGKSGSEEDIGGDGIGKMSDIEISTFDKMSDIEISSFDADQSSNPSGKTYIVVLKRSAMTMADTASVAYDICTRFGTVPDRVYNTAIKGFAVTLPNTAGVAESFMMDAMFEESMVDYIMEDEEIFAFQVGLSRVGADQVNFWTGKEDSVAVAILDTGVDKNHGDINIVDLDNHCKSFVDNEGDCDDGNGHGTHVAGTACGATTGVAPGCKIWALKVLNSGGSGTIAGIIAGLEYVYDNAAEIDVVNMSLGGNSGQTSCDDDCNCNNNAFHEQVCMVIAKGVVVVVAAGNSNTDASGTVPANFDDVITVSAMADSDGSPGGNGPDLRGGADEDDEFASFSNYGSKVDIAAPGVSIYSTYTNGGYATISGTSMASPHVAGAAALYIAKNGKPSSRDGVLAVKAGLLAAADDQDGDRGFDGDPDDDEEPMLNVANLNDGGTPPATPVPPPPPQTPVPPPPTPVPPPPTPVTSTIRVQSITYDERIVSNQERLYVTIVVDPNVPDARVYLELYEDGDFRGSANGLTNDEGSIAFYLPNPDDEDYTTTITNIEFDGYEYDPSKNANDPGYECCDF